MISGVIFLSIEATVRDYFVYADQSIPLYLQIVLIINTSDTIVRILGIQLIPGSLPKITLPLAVPVKEPHFECLRAAVGCEGVGEHHLRFQSMAFNYQSATTSVCTMYG